MRRAIDAIRSHPSAGIAIAGLGFGLAAAILLFAFGPLGADPPPAPEPPESWYYDLNTGELFRAHSRIPPIEAPSGDGGPGMPPGVSARIFGCGDCDGSLFLGYLVAYTPLAQRYHEAAPERESELRARMKRAPDYQGRLVSRPPDGSKWFPFGSDRAEAIRASAEKRCPDEPLYRCSPESAGRVRVPGGRR